MTERNLDQPQADRIWMLQFLRWNIPTTMLYGLVILALFALTGHITFLISALLTLAYAGLLVWSRVLVNRDRLTLSAALAGGGLSVIALGTVVHAPSLWPMALLLNLLAAVVVLPYLRPALARGYFAMTWLLCLLLMALAMWVRIIPEQVPYLPVIQLITTGSVLSFILFVLWQYHAQLTLLITRSNAANQALRVAQASLEAEVEARTQALREERDFAVALTTAMAQGLSVTDAEGRYIYVNPALAAMTGYPADELVGRPVADLVPPEERERLRAILGERSTGQASTYEMRMICADGRAIYVLTSGVPRFRDGRYVGSIAVITDLTERRLMEQALQDERDFALSVMNTVGQGLLVADATGRYEFVNEAAARMLGYTPEQIVGRLPYDFTFPEEWERLNGAMARRREGLAGSYEIRMRRIDGSPAYGLVTGAPRFRDGRFAGSIVVVTDLTERKRIEEALAFARDEAIAASRLKSEFLANMSHELRTPLNVVLGVSDLLTMTELTAEQRKLVDMVRASGKTLLALISDILDLARIEAGRLELKPVRFEPELCARAAVELAAPLVAEKGLALRLTVGGEVPAVVIGDEQRLQQVLANLLSNAVKFTHEGAVEVELNAQPDEASGGVQLYWVVRDTGIGIPPERLSDIFEPFIQIDASSTRRYGGTGLGLAICRRLVSLMGGAIWAKSELGRGSSFSFTCLCEPVGEDAPAEG